jgi:hypothetical protein
MDLSIFSALLDQLFHTPGSLLLTLFVAIIAYFLEIWQWFQSKYVGLACILIGAILYPLLVKPTVVAADFPHPLVVLVLDGIILAFVAVIIHASLIKWLIAKYQPKLTDPTSNRFAAPPTDPKTNPPNP